jgi:hypothetical protein
MSVSKDPEPRRIDPQNQHEDPNEPLPPPLPDDEIDPNEHPNAVPDPWHDTRAVHGDSGNPPPKRPEADNV